MFKSGDGKRAAAADQGRDRLGDEVMLVVRGSYRKVDLFSTIVSEAQAVED